MKFAFFAGCKVPYFLPEYEKSTREVLNVLGIELVDIEFNCCGYPVRHIDFKASMLSAARNIALAKQQKLDILTPCKCCYGNFKHAQHFINKHASLKEEINKILAEEGLKIEGETKVKHFLSVLMEDVGIENIKQKVKNPQKNIKIAAHYGCHALRPSEITQFDNPFSPTIFETLISATGATPVDWSKRLDCCGNPLWEKNNQLSLKLMTQKLESALEAEAAYICTACNYCQIQFDSIKKSFIKDPKFDNLKSILFSQVLGSSLGI